MIIAGHTMAELYGVLSTLPVKPRIAPAVAWRLIHENVENLAKIVSLAPTEHTAVIKKISDSGLSGGIIYDALIAKVAQKVKVDRLLTFNSDHFKRVWPDGKNVIFTP